MNVKLHNDAGCMSAIPNLSSWSAMHAREGADNIIDRETAIVSDVTPRYGADAPRRSTKTVPVATNSLRPVAIPWSSRASGGKNAPRREAA